jgi:DNA repair protein RadA/Sms
VGGFTVDEPAADLAVAVAIASSMRNIPVKADAVLIGEVGLSGELRMVGQMPARLREAANLGFRTAIVPRRLRRGEPWPDNIQIVEARSCARPRRRPALRPHKQQPEAGDHPANEAKSSGRRFLVYSFSLYNLRNLH